jgi:hypothetical protein
MSKNLSLDIKTLYQVGLGLVGTICAVLIILNGYNVVQLLAVPKAVVSLRMREQQLKTAIQIIQQNQQNQPSN